MADAGRLRVTYRHMSPDVSQQQRAGAADVCIVGGAGHVGLPLGLVLADSGLNVRLLDVNGRMLDEVRAGRMPFEDRGAQELLGKVLAEGRLSFSTETSAIQDVPVVIVTIDQ